MKTLITLIAIILFSTTNTFAQNNAAAIKINPIRIADGKVTVKLVNQPTGTYTIKLVDANGTVLAVKEVAHEEGTSAEIIEAGKTLTGGMYQVEVVNPRNIKTTNKVLLLM